MQNPFLKFLWFVFVLALIPISSRAQSFGLNRADSLFQEKRYTQSFELYQYTFDHQHYTPSMLLKMAFVEEGLNHVAKALYYLNLYYLATRDESVQRKIEELASKFKLEGHTFTQKDKAIAFYHQFDQPITIVLACLSVLLLSIMVYFKRRNVRPIATFIFLFLVLSGLIVHLNFAEPSPGAIIAKSNTYIMTGPSAGASVLTTSREGHRVEVLGHYDVWTKIKWNDRVAFVKQDNLLSIKL